MSSGGSPLSSTDRKTGSVIATVATCVIVFLLVCVGSIVAIGLGAYQLAVVSPIVLHAGSVSLSIDVTDNPECSPLMRGCLAIPPAHSPDYFTVWGAMTTTNSQGQLTRAHKVLELQVP